MSQETLQIPSKINTMERTLRLGIVKLTKAKVQGKILGMSDKRHNR